MNACFKIFILIIILSSCQKREWSNPFDPEYSKELWTPTNFRAIQEGSSIILTWSQPNKTISEFKIQKTIDNGSRIEVKNQYKADGQLFDPVLEYNKTHTYYLTAIAGNNTSNPVAISITPLVISSITYNTNLSYGTISDIDGNVYKTIKIGAQTWMAENLKTTRYNDGTSIAKVTYSTVWAGLTSGAYCWYNAEETIYKTYGALYNWYAVNTGKLAPTGWHVPTDSEWATLTSYLGGESVAGGKLKEMGTSHWVYPNNGASNESGFTGLPSASRDANGTTSGKIGFYNLWWSSSMDNTAKVWSRLFFLDGNELIRVSSDKAEGLSIRCIKD
ncbi:MAG: fibrobacter succinogenes major paralogous domain-containing protein [Prolixibacteraceae bacterium]|nr:fibrobacter succinogenes major paralogous domain-containing protein [Prolixibacteraceae bacterium]